MKLLVVMAHFDTEGILRQHSRDAITNYARSASRVIVVSTSGIKDALTADFPDNVEFIDRDNYGYDFFSYKWGLDAAGDYTAFDRVLIVNDSFVGPLIPVEDILSHPNVTEVDFAGMTLSESHIPHAQSFFFTFTSAVSKSKSFRSFWQDMVPVSDRMKVIHQYELGLTRSVTQGGFKIGSYFRPTLEEEALARRRREWHLKHRTSQKHPGKTMFEVSPDAANARSWNPAAAFADRVLEAGRLPLLKFDVLRFDPYALGADHLLKMCEQADPNSFIGVREFLNQTSKSYPFRPGERNLPPSPGRLVETGVGYCYDTNNGTSPL